MGKVIKSIEILDAKISFVSLVNKAANKKQFLITKEEDGKARFASYGKIVKVDNENHYVTGIVYEPLVKDAHDNFMTAEEIQKAAYWYAKNGDKVDIQHSFEAMSDACVVENWIEKADTTIEDEEIKKGTWLMTVEISDSDVWDKIVKGDITGFSMGGVGAYADEDVELNIEKGDAGMSENGEEKVGLLKKLAKALGIDGFEKLSTVTKGEMEDEYNRRQKSSSFWNAMNTLQELLSSGHWDYSYDHYVYSFENDEQRIKDALSDFDRIITDILCESSITKALELEAPKNITKAGKKMSSGNKEKLDNLYQALSEFKTEFDEPDEEEEEDVKKEDMDQIEKMIQSAVTKALEREEPIKEKSNIEKSSGTDGTLSMEAMEKMIQSAVTKALSNEEDEESEEEPVEKSAVTVKDVEAMISKALSSVLKGRSNLNEEPNVQKNEGDHYLHGIL